MAEEAKLGKTAAKRLAWARGLLAYKCDAGQREIRQAVYDAPGERIFINMSRRRGKTYFLCLLAIEFALKHPNSEIKYAAATAKAVKKMVRPNFRKILSDCPDELRPKWSSLDGEYRFPNGSVITIAGCDNENFENLRGTEAHLVIIDEGGFVDDLEPVVDDVLAPQVLETGGNIIIGTTPPRSLDHYAVRFLEGCIRRGAEIGKKLYFHQTLYDNPRLSPARIEQFIRQQAGTVPVEEYKKSASFRREFLAELLPDMERAVVPEWHDGGKDKCVGRQVRPSHFDSYTAQDIGFSHGWGVLFSYWDFRKARLVIEKELLFHKTRSEVVAEATLKTERMLWGDNKRPWRRISDNDLLTIADMEAYGIHFTPTAKDDLELQVNRVREWVRAGKLLIDPEGCPGLIHQLSTGIWNKVRSGFQETEDGHYDLLAALVYLARNIDHAHNPFPTEDWRTPEGMFRANPFRPSGRSEVGQNVISMLAFRRRAG